MTGRTPPSFGYRELIRATEWVEHTLPVQTAAMGTKEERFLRGAAKLGLPHQTSKDITWCRVGAQENAILQPKGTAGRTNDRQEAHVPRRRGLHILRPLPAGCIEPVKSPRNLRAKQSTHTSYVPMALTADRWTRGRQITLLPDSFAVRVRPITIRAASGVTWRNTRTGALTNEAAKVVVLAAGPVETPRLWLNSGLPNLNDQVGRGLADHYLDYLVGRFTTYTGSEQGPDVGGAIGLSRFRWARAGRRVSPGTARRQSLSFRDSGIAGLLRQAAVQ